MEDDPAKFHGLSMETISRFIDYTTVLKRDIRPTESAVTLHPTDQATSLTELRYIKVTSTNIYIHFWFSWWLNLSGPSGVYIFPCELIQRWTGQYQLEISFMNSKHAALFANHILWKESPSQQLSHPFLLLVKFQTGLQLQKNEMVALNELESTHYYR